jgi:hypothetical protein
LNALCFLELRLGILSKTHGVQDPSEHRSVAHAFKSIAASVGKLDALPGPRHGLVELAAALEKFTKGGGAGPNQGTGFSARNS